MTCSRCHARPANQGQRYCGPCFAAAMRESRARAKAKRTPAEIKRAADQARANRVRGAVKRWAGYKAVFGGDAERDRDAEREYNRMLMSETGPDDKRAEFERMLENNPDLTIGTIADALGVSEWVCKGWYNAGHHRETWAERNRRIFGQVKGLGTGGNGFEDDRNNEQPVRHYDRGRVAE